MKRAKRLTRKQKELVTQKGLNCANWELLRETKEKYYLIHKHTRTRKNILK